MTTPLDRKVRQLDNDVEAIYGMLSTIETTQRRQLNRLTEVENRLAEHTATLAEHTATLAEHGSKLDRILALLEAR